MKPLKVTKSEQMAYNFGKKKERGEAFGKKMKCQAFARFYIEELNDGKKAAMRLGFSPKTASAAAHRLLKEKYTQDMLRAIIRRANAKEIATVEWRKETLQRIAEANADTMSAKIAIEAIAELNKMDGSYAPTKTENKSVVATADLSRIQELLEEYKREY